MQTVDAVSIRPLVSMFLQFHDAGRRVDHTEADGDPRDGYVEVAHGADLSQGMYYENERGFQYQCRLVNDQGQTKHIESVSYERDPDSGLETLHAENYMVDCTGQVGGSIIAPANQPGFVFRQKPSTPSEARQRMDHLTAEFEQGWYTCPA